MQRNWAECWLHIIATSWNYIGWITAIIYAWDFKITQLKLIEEIININKADESMHGRLITLGIDL